jgi:predicted CXXCH cytochrome family protein
MIKLLPLSALICLSSGSPADESRLPTTLKTHFAYKRYYPTKPLTEAEGPRWTHAAYQREACSICHVSNDRTNPGKLRAPTNQLCIGCHRQIGTLLKTRSSIHRPVADDCTYCHNPHNSTNRMLLYAPPQALCTRCHDGIKTLVETSSVRHDAVIKGNTCNNCHSVHGSSFDHLLSDRPADLCLDCHGADSLKDSTGAPLVNLEKLLDENPYQHEPIHKKDCSVCHAAHGSSHFRLLNKAYPEGMYAAYSPKTYELCIDCHDNEESFSKDQTTMTGFRQGEKNLHAVHLKREDRGRTCRTCHGEHATPIAHLIRESVPFGGQGWSLNVNYIPEADGGRCIRSCHETKVYHNDGGLAAHKIAVGKTVPNATLPSLDGKSIQVISSTLLNLFIFFDPNQERSLAALKVLSRLCKEPDHSRVQCTAVVSDRFTKQVVGASLDQTGWDKSRTVIDGKDKYFKQLGLFLHPSFWIVSNTARLVRYEPYVDTDRDVFSRLEALVKQALGDITNDQLAHVLSPPSEKNEPLMDRAELNLKFAKKLVTDKKMDQALIHAERAVDINATLTEAYLLIGEIYIDQQHCELAVPYLNETLRLEPKNSKALKDLEGCKQSTSRVR